MPLLSLVGLLAVAVVEATSPQLLRKEHFRSPSLALEIGPEAQWAQWEATQKQHIAAFGGLRAPTGHHVNHLEGLAAAFEEMKALTSDPAQAFLPAAVEATSDVVQEECAAAGELCRKAVDFVAGRVPAAEDEKLDFLCGPEALECLSKNLEKCHSFQESIASLQSQWSCEARSCSSRGADCQRVVHFLDTDDQELSSEQRLQKTRFLCSDAGVKCISDHKDSCMTAFEIVSMAHDLRHCDRVRCTDAGEGCQRAVNFLTQEDLGNLTHHKVEESQAKWDYLCSDGALTCLEENIDKCQRYRDFLKGSFGNGHCSFVQCAKAGGDCKKAVVYLSQVDTEHTDKEVEEKHAFLCGQAAMECFASNEQQCSPYKEMLKQMMENECLKKPVVKTTIPPTSMVLDARSDASRTAAQAVVKARASPSSARQAAEIAAEEEAAEARKQEEKRMLAKATAISQGEESGDLEATPAKAAKAAKETGSKDGEGKKAAGRGAVVAVLAFLAVAAGLFFWRRRKASAKGGSKPGERGSPPKPRKPGRAKGAEAEGAPEEAGKSAGVMARLQRYAGFASIASMSSFARFRRSKDKKEDKPDEPASEAESQPKEAASSAGLDSGDAEPAAPPVFSGDQVTASAGAAEEPDKAPEEEPKEY